MIIDEAPGPAWLKLVIMVIFALAALAIWHCEPDTADIEEDEEVVENHVQERYGRYVQLRGKYYD